MPIMENNCFSKLYNTGDSQLLSFVQKLYTGLIRICSRNEYHKKPAGHQIFTVVEPQLQLHGGTNLSIHRSECS